MTTDSEAAQHGQTLYKRNIVLVQLNIVTAFNSSMVVKTANCKLKRFVNCFAKCFVKQNRLQNKIGYKTKQVAKQNRLQNKIGCKTKQVTTQNMLQNKIGCKTKQVAKQNSLQNKIGCKTKQFNTQNMASFSSVMRAQRTCVSAQQTTDLPYSTLYTT